MRIVLITQDEPFYLYENLEHLFRMLPPGADVVGCVLADVSPFGKKETFAQKARKTMSIFGLRFFVHYASKYIGRKLSSRGSIRRFLREYKVPVIELSSSINSPASLEAIRAYRPDLLISILGNQIFKTKLLKLAPHGCLNLHTALLPKYRGLMPTFWVLLNDERTTGVSVFYVDDGIDSGPILVQKEIAIGDASQEDLIRQTKRLGMEAIAEAVEMIIGGSVSLIDNDSRSKSYYSFPTRDDVKAFARAGKRFY